MQVGIGEEILGVRLHVPKLGALRLNYPGTRRGQRGEIRIDGLLPRSHLDEDVRRHVQGMDRRRRNLGVAPSCCQRAVGQHGVVIGVDNVMSHAWMIGRLSEDFFQDGAGFLLVSVAGVAWRRVRD